MSSVPPTEDARRTASEALPLSHSERRRVQQGYDQAQRLMGQGRYDFSQVHALLAECITSDPGNLLYLDAFFANLAKKYGNRTGNWLQRVLRRSSLKQSLAHKQWLAVLKAGTEVLKVSPWDVTTLRGMAEACEHLGGSEAALRYLSHALEGNPNDMELHRHWARLLTRLGRYEQAIAVWTRLAKERPNDTEAPQMIGELQAETTPGHSSGALRKDSPSFAEAGEGILALEEAIRRDPTHVENYLELAAMYADVGRVVDAETTLHKGLAASGHDLRVRERLEEVHILWLKQQLAIAERRAKADATDAAKDLVMQLRENLNRVELEMFGHRAQRYPAEAHWKLELGIRLKRAGNFSEAIKRLAEIGSESDLAAAATLETGESWQHLRQYPRALQAYHQAIELAEKRADADQLKLALYRGGVLGAAMGDPAGAEMLSRLVALDASYRDAKERLARLTSASS